MTPTWLAIQNAFAQDGEGTGNSISVGNDQSGNVSKESAQGQIEALEARLLGELPSDTQMNAPYESNEIVGLVWILPVFIFMVALLVWSRLRQSAPINPGEIRVLSKTPLGKEGSLAVIVVGEADGAEQKMLVGLSENGAPRLLSVLDAKWSQAQQSESRGRVGDGTEGPSVQATEALADFDQFLAQVPPANSENKVGASEPQLEDRKDLVNELLSARGINEVQHSDHRNEEDQEVAVHPYAPTSFDDAKFGAEEDSVVDDDPWVVNFRRKYQQS